MTPDQMAKSNAYFEGGYWIQLWSLVLGLLLSWVLLKSGASARIRDLVKRWSRFDFLTDCFYIAIYLVLTTVILLPFSIYTDYFREHAYGLSNLNFRDWTVEFLKGGGVGLVLITIFLAVIFSLIRRFKKSWWIWASVATSVFFMIVIVIAPVFISPMFNTYKPLAAGPIRDSVLAMAHSNGIPADEVWQFDASKQSNRVSANVSGMFGTMRISLNDNLLKRCNEAEIRAVMGHEMGHYVMNHGFKSLVMISLVWLVGFGFVYFVMESMLVRVGSGWGIRSAGDIAALPLLVAIFSVFSTLSMPVLNTIVRTQEAEADMFGLNLAREPDGESEVAVKLGEYRKMSPSPVEEFIFFDHPSGENRIRVAQTWKYFSHSNSK